MSERGKALWALLVLTLVWGEAWVWWRQMLDLAGPMTAIFHRLVVATVSLFLAMRVLGLRLKPGTPLRQCIAIGATQTGLFFILQVWAVLQGGPGKTSILIFTMPVWMLLLSGPLLGERISAAQWLPVAITIAGLLVIIAPWEGGGSFSQLLAIGAALCWAVSGILIKRLGRVQAIDLFNLNAWQMLYGTLLVAVALPFVTERPVAWGSDYLWLLFILGVISTGAGWVLWGYILKRLPAWQASLSVLGIPVVANVSAHWTLGEQSSPGELAGMACIGVGLALLSWITWRQEKAKPAAT